MDKSFAEVISGLEMKFGPEEGDHYFRVTGPHEALYAPNPEYKRIPELRLRECCPIRKNTMNLRAESRTDSGLVVLTSQAFFLDDDVPEILLFTYSGNRKVICDPTGQKFSASPREVYEEHRRWQGSGALPAMNYRSVRFTTCVLR